MPYSKTTWVEGTTGITAARLNNIESGVEVGYNNAILYASATGSANAYIVTLNPAPAALTEGLCIAVKINVDSTGISTINVNGLGAKGIKKANGNDVTNLKAGGIYTLRYNGTNFQLLGEGGEYGTVGVGDVKVGVTFGTENGVATGTFTSDATAVANDIIASKTAYVNGNKVTGTIPDRGAGGTKTPTASNITLPAGRYTTDIVISGVSVPVANVLTGTTIAGQAGTMPNKSMAISQAVDVIGNQLAGRIYMKPANGYYDGINPSAYTYADDPDFIASNIPNTKNIFGLQGTLEHIDINGIIASYNVVSGGATINAGDFVSYVNNGSLTVFKNVSTSNVCAVQLETNKVLVAFSDETYNAYGCAVVLTINGNVITAGTTLVYASYHTTQTAVCALSSTKVILGYSTYTNSARARVLTISGTTVTSGSEVSLMAEADCSYGSVGITMIDSTRALMVWNQQYVPGGVNQGQCAVLYAPSMTITPSTVLTFDGTGGGSAEVCEVDTNKAVAVWYASGYVYARVLVVGASGATWGSSGSIQQWEGGPGNYSGYFSMAKLSAGKIIIAYGDGGNTKTKIFTVSGTTISFGTLYTYDTACSSITGVAITALSSTTAVVGYVYYASADYYIVTNLSISGNVITKGTRTSLGSFSHNSTAQFNGMATANPSTAVFAFQNRINSNYGTAVALPQNGVKKAVSPDAVFGIARTTGAAGAAIDVYKVY